MTPAGTEPGGVSAYYFNGSILIVILLLSMIPSWQITIMIMVMIYELRHYYFEEALDAFTITCLLD